MTIFSSWKVGLLCLGFATGVAHSMPVVVATYTVITLL